MKLLNKDDVIEAILREHKKSGDLTPENHDHYRGKIKQSYQIFMARLETATKPDIEHYKILFQLLKSLCEFWFANRKTR